MSHSGAVVGLVIVVCLAGATKAQAHPTPPTDAQTAPTASAVQIVTCESSAADRVHCPANTVKGVVLMKSTGTGECLAGTTWGFDADGVWVSHGCSGEFALSGTAQPAAGAPDTERKPTPRIEGWGEFDPGEGFLVGRNGFGELGISGYGLIRFVNQSPGTQTFTDHLGNERTTDGRSDIYPHRVMVFFKGWMGSPKLIYTIILWTVNTTDQDALFVTLGYQFSRRFSVYAGLNGNPGTRSLQGSHPYWLGHDRVMADEFFRPYFGNGLTVQGEISPGLWYNAMVGNNSSSLGIKATQLDRHYTGAASVWWMPTTKEFGPKGAYGDWEGHERVATRFGASFTNSREERFPDAVTGGTGNTTIRLADSVNIFDRGALAPDVTVDYVDYRMLAIDAGAKYRGLFLQAEIYSRWLDNFKADGVLPVASIADRGFYVQAAFYPVPKKLELYGITSQIFGDEDAGFGNASEYGAGLNFYPVNSRNHRLNVQYLDVNRSPVSSTFGYYTGGLRGSSLSTAFSVYF